MRTQQIVSDDGQRHDSGDEIERKAHEAKLPETFLQPVGSEWSVNLCLD